MRVLLTGGAGYIGSHTAVILSMAGHDVVILDNFSNSKPGSVAKISNIIGKPIIFYEGDIRSTWLVKEILRNHHIEAVIHFAGLKAVANSVCNPIEYFSNNVGGTISLLEAMRSLNIKNIVFSSSAPVYGEPKYLPIDESHPLNAVNPYGRSKIHIEEILRDLAKSDPNWKIMSLRYFNPIGAHDSGLIGEDPRDIPNNLMPYIIKVALGEVPSLNIFGGDYKTSDGTGLRDYIHVMDLAEGHLDAISFLKNHYGFYVVNLGTGTGFTVKEIVDTFVRVTHKKVPYQIVSRRIGDIEACFALVKNAKDLLGWKAKRDLNAMCLSAWKFGSLTND